MLRGESTPARRGPIDLAMHPLVSVEWLKARLGSPDVLPADCRFSLRDPAAGRRAYKAGHIPGAVFFDLEGDLSAPKGEHGGRHPLPAPEACARTFGERGIGPGITVVAYDDDGSFAARLWWMLRYLGHDDVAVLDGGIGAWRAAGGPVTTEATQRAPRIFTPRPRPEMVVDMATVRGRPSATVLLDARGPERYRGEVEPLDRIPGRIPGAVHAWWEESLDADRRWLPPEAQRERFARLVGDRPAIAACGSGVTACADLLALALAGRWDVPLYAGSYSDWVSYPENPVEKG
jgi:thiosulfate/3-mercaptopyruvate sulfurtransferase